MIRPLYMLVVAVRYSDCQAKRGDREVGEGTSELYRKLIAEFCLGLRRRDDQSVFDKSATISSLAWHGMG